MIFRGPQPKDGDWGIELSRNGWFFNANFMEGGGPLGRNREGSSCRNGNEAVAR